MYTRKRYSIKNMILWTRVETIVLIFIALLPTVLYKVFGFTWLHLPWLPIALIGTAVAFIISFQNNVAYDRLWEARKIWGGIVNVSRFWAVMVMDNINNDEADIPKSEEELYNEKKTFIYRHIAWMAALRHAMRQLKPWESLLDDMTNREWHANIVIPERDISLEEELSSLISEEEQKYVLERANKATAILSLQSRHLDQLKKSKHLWKFTFLEMENIIKDLFDLQGKSERIKNFPYPRQYATLNSLFLWIFIILLPFGVIPEFTAIGQKIIANFPTIGDYFVWASIPFIVIISWVFHTMERIGRVSENPFEGSPNDVPISTIARGIEIDLRQMLAEGPDRIPKPYPSKYDVQM
ncbi:bestrophin family protein [Marinigracilibium pacificum]|uniref:Multidrug transporter n=1 Tax=Marinigracilibium pacificum TaxID=2729599 RepID=A0A848IT53_9BACT|nr:bestrophin family ion channel [Marinigracilibium pacificum]NMM47517.1 hypothetical protein [Marinigracilibium pacificum]